MTIQGKRQDITDEHPVLEPGEYGKHHVDGNWYCQAPGEGDFFGNLSKHTVVEHEDGTITVSPSILISRPHTGESWHGYLERGVWREV